MNSASAANRRPVAPVQRLRGPVKLTLAHLGYYSRPSFLVIGAQKAGTTSLDQYLNFHPQINRAHGKELQFFNREYARGLYWYHSKFPLPHRLLGGKITFEATPDYIAIPQAMERIHAYNPQIKMILILRNPVERAYSEWSMWHYRLYNPPPFPEAIEQDIVRINRGETEYSMNKPFHIVHYGLYDEQLAHFLTLFSRQQLLILESGEAWANPARTMRRCTEFLGLPDFDWESQTYTPREPGHYDAPIPARARERLAAFFRPHNERLYNLLGVDFGWN